MNIQDYLKGLGYTPEEISDVPPEMLANWQRVIKLEGVDQDMAQKFLHAKLLLLVDRVIKPPETLWQSILTFIGRDPFQAAVKAELNVVRQMLGLLDYDPRAEFKKFDEEMKKRISGK